MSWLFCCAADESENAKEFNEPMYTGNEADTMPSVLAVSAQAIGIGEDVYTSKTLALDCSAKAFGGTMQISRADRIFDRRFRIKISRRAPEQSLGVCLDTIDGLMVNALKEGGLLQEYNDRCEAQDLRLRAGDFVVSVNEEMDPLEAIPRLLVGARELDIMVIRPARFEAILDKDVSGGLGLGVRFGTNMPCRSLVVTVISGGAVASWNEAQPIDEHILLGDRIMRVQAEGPDKTPLVSSSEASEMAAILQNYSRFRLEMTRRL